MGAEAGLKNMHLRFVLKGPKGEFGKKFKPNLSTKKWLKQGKQKL